MSLKRGPNRRKNTTEKNLPGLTYYTMDDFRCHSSGWRHKREEPESRKPKVLGKDPTLSSPMAHKSGCREL